MATTDPVLRAQSHLTERDLTLMDWLHDHGVLTSFQIAAALYPSLDFAQKRLTRLVDLQVINRFRQPRPVGGTYPYHYVLDQLGYDIIAAQRGQDRPRRTHAAQRRDHFTSRANLPHLLGLNQFFIDLATHARTHPDSAALQRWWSTAQTSVPYVFGLTPGSTVLLPMRPDGHGIFVQDGTRVAFWFEYDTSSEPLSTLVEKVRAYDKGARTYQRRELADWPALFSLASWQREDNLHARIAKLDNELWQQGKQGLVVPVATTNRQQTRFSTRPADAIRGRPDDDDLASPAERVWRLYGAGYRRLRPGDLPEAITETTSREATDHGSADSDRQRLLSPPDS